MTIRFLAIALPLALLLSAGAAMQDYFAGDLFLARAIQGVRAPPWKEAMELVSYIGRWLPMAVLAMALLAWFLWRRQWAESFAVGGALLSFGLTPLLKVIVQRPRPAEELVVVWHNQGGPGFPSGHAFTALLLFGLLFYLAPRVFPGRGAVVVVRIASPLLILLIGLSRVYLGVHWPSDVLGGFLFGSIVLALLIRLHQAQSSQRELSETA